jgi:uncharacterized protein (DUF433 family)
MRFMVAGAAPRHQDFGESKDSVPIMSIIIHPDHVPLRVDDEGTIRVGNTRITLDVFVADHRRGMTAEQIVEQLGTLTLSDVYGALAYYYQHKDELDEYLERRCEAADRMQREIEAGQPAFAEVKARLLVRRTGGNASPAQ